MERTETSLEVIRPTFSDVGCTLKGVDRLRSYQFCGSCRIFREYGVRRWNLSIWIHGTPSHSLIDAVKNRRESFVHRHVLGRFPGQGQFTTPKGVPFKTYPSSSTPYSERSISSTRSLIACLSRSFGRWRCSVRTLPETVTTRSRGGNRYERTSSANGSSTSTRHSKSGSMDGASSKSTGPLSSFVTSLATANESNSYKACMKDDSAMLAFSLDFCPTMTHDADMCMYR